MKPILFLLSFFFFTGVNSQITFEHSPPDPVYKFSTTNGGDKFFMLGATDTSGVVTILNADWSVRSVDTLPSGWNYTDFVQVNGYGPVFPSMSDELFNSDTLIEFLIVKYTIQYPVYYKYEIVNELGQLVFAFPDSSVGSGVALYNVNGSFKASYTTYNTVNPLIYSLPGTLPCNQCSLINTAITPNPGEVKISLNAYPNPFNNTLVVEYNLQQQQQGQLTLTTVDGKVVNTMHLTRSQDRLELNTANLPKGIIIASIYDNNQQLVSKKLVKIE